MCASSCQTKDHASWGDCIRSQRIAVLGNNIPALSAWDKELSAYQDARAKGIQPAGTTMAKVKAAERISDQLGRPYNAEAKVRVLPE